MVVTPLFPPVTLPVTLIVGDYTADVGTLTLDPGETVAHNLADLFRAAADALDRAGDQEVSPDATA
ncbi:hypothetical protein [Streptomyces sp. SID5910]|uniref:hypothetical protein n=1 Tax=Streptomyces sp. SID5910 TaxID=2690312 RepID=UPI0013699D03|nr:hypothetical protein [Streptomyces sp. SID5910]MYR46605.1 hypothetical protein [Streptomyces sp. SID5910]